MKFSRSEYGCAANTHCPFSFALNFQRNNFSASRKSFGSGTSNELKVHVRKGLHPAAVIRQVGKIQNRRLGADEKIWQHRIVGILAAILAERHARAPGGIRIQRNFFEITQILPRPDLLPKEREQPATVPVLRKSTRSIPMHDITRDGG